MGKIAPDWNDLCYFLLAVQEGTLSGAARKLGVKHSTVGRRLSALEHALGAAVVMRGPDGLYPTQVGLKIMPLVEDMNTAVQAICTACAKQKTRIRLAMPTGFSRMFSENLALLRE